MYNDRWEWPTREFERLMELLALPTGHIAWQTDTTAAALSWVCLTEAPR